MKKILLAMLAMATVSVANAQKNTILTYGTAGVSTNKVDNSGGNEIRNVNWHVMPGIGYQFTDHITVGLQGGFGQMRTETDQVALNVLTKTLNVNNDWSAGVFFRYTYRVNKWFAFFDQLDLSYLSGKQYTEVTAAGIRAPRVEDTYNGFGARLFPAVQLFVYDGFALNFNFGGLEYRTTTMDKAPTTTSSFDLTLGNQFNFGISRNLGGCCHKGGHMKPGDDYRPIKMLKDDEDDDE